MQTQVTLQLRKNVCKNFTTFVTMRSNSLLHFLVVITLLILRSENPPDTSYSAYVATSTESYGVKIDGLLHTTKFIVDSENVSEK